MWDGEAIKCMYVWFTSIIKFTNDTHEWNY